MNTELINTGLHIGKIVITSPAVQGVVSSLITTLFVRRGENIKAMEAFKAREFEKAAKELLSDGKLSYVELYKCRNFLKVAKRADEIMGDFLNNDAESVQSGSDKDKFSFDWLMRFFDAVGNISNDDLQRLWGKVLANEIKRSKSCSLRTLDMVRNMPPEEAKTFSLLCRFVMQSGDSYYIDAAGFFCEEDGHQECRDYIQKLELSYEEHIVPMLEAGALSIDHDLAIYINKDNNLEFHNDKLCGVVIRYDDKPVLFQREAYFLTYSGKELFHIIHDASGYEADEEYALLCLKEIKRKNPQFYVGAFSRLGQDNLSVDLLKES
ncbi:MAG: DUF2806 domain-containing protein [Lachnospiraceae bacterium]|nr:DUF2806 domain-containing protein [Lachnospiraceae bacterium]